jgi:phage tail-like protein
VAVDSQIPTFWLLDGRIGWQTDQRDGVTVGATSGIRLAAEPDGPLAADSPDGSLGGIRLPRGFALDPEGTLYVLVGRSVLRFDPKLMGFVALPTVGDTAGEGVRNLHQPVDIAIAGKSLYVADRKRLLVFERRTLALVDFYGWARWKLAGLAAHGRQVWLLDRRYGRVYQHCAGRRGLRLFVDVSEALNVSAAGGRFAQLAVDREDRVYVLDKSARVLRVFDAAGRLEPTPDNPGDLRERFDLPPIRLDHRGRFCLPPSLALECGRRLPTTGPPPEDPLSLCTSDSCRRLCDGSGRPVTCYPAEPPGPRAHRTQGSWSGEPPDGEISRCQRACGRCSRTVCASERCGILFDRLGQPLTVDPAEPPGPRLYRTQGTWISEALDSEIYRCQWHRIELDLSELPAGTRVLASTYADEQERAIDEIAEDLWSPSSAVTSHANDLLVQSRGGRYLRLRLELQGDGYATPAIHSIRAHFPRESYLRFLPAIYAADDESRWFLERFLAAFQTEWDRLEEEIADVERYFDPAAVPAGAPLDYLAAWLALPAERRWRDEQRRLLLAAAPRIYRRRGTPAAVRDYLRAYLETMTNLRLGEDGYPQLAEAFRERDLLLLGASGRGRVAPLWSPQVTSRLQLGVFAREGQTRMISTGDPHRDAFQEYAHRFRVFVPAAWAQSAEDERMIRRAVDAERPAQTAYDLCLVEPRFRVGVQSTVGLDWPSSGAAQIGFRRRAPTRASTLVAAETSSSPLPACPRRAALATTACWPPGPHALHGQGSACGSASIRP